MQTPLVFLAVLSVLVLIHELGHYLAARMFGIRVDEFAFGLPFTKPIFSKKFGETTYSIYPLLFGGFVKLHGEESEVKTDQKRSFFERGKKQRVVVIAAGVIMNFLLAFVIFAGIYKFVGLPKQTTNKLVVAQIAPGSPAEQVGLLVEDRIVMIEDKKIANTTDFIEVVKSWAGVGVNITVERGESLVMLEGLVEKNVETKSFYVIPRLNPPKDEGALGVAVVEMPFVEVIKCSGLDVGCQLGFLKQGVVSTGMWMGRVVDGLRSIGKSIVERQVPKDLSGPVGIYQLTGDVAQAGILPLLELVAILSVNLGVFNILPIPALDGGRILFVFIEWIRRKKLTAEFEQRVNSIGMTILLLMIALITLQDLIRIGILEKIMGIGK